MKSFESLVAELLGFKQKKPGKIEKKLVFWCAVVHCVLKNLRIIIKIGTEIAHGVRHLVQKFHRNPSGCFHAIEFFCAATGRSINGDKEVNEPITIYQYRFVNNLHTNTNNENFLS